MIGRGKEGAHRRGSPAVHLDNGIHGKVGIFPAASCNLTTQGEPSNKGHHTLRQEEMELKNRGQPWTVREGLWAATIGWAKSDWLFHRHELGLEPRNISHVSRAVVVGTGEASRCSTLPLAKPNDGMTGTGNGGGCSVPLSSAPGSGGLRGRR